MWFSINRFRLLVTVKFIVICFVAWRVRYNIQDFTNSFGHFFSVEKIAWRCKIDNFLCKLFFEVQELFSLPSLPILLTFSNTSGKAFFVSGNLSRACTRYLWFSISNILFETRAVNDPSQSFTVPGPKNASTMDFFWLN